VFVTLRAPRRPIRADLVGDVVQRHCLQAGVPHVGPHRLRHTLATEMLAAGAALSEISQVLDTAISRRPRSTLSRVPRRCRSREQTNTAAGELEGCVTSISR